MRIHQLRVYGFENATLAGLLGVVNQFANGDVLTAMQTGTLAYAAGESRNKELIDRQYVFDGVKYTCVLFYSEVG